MVSQWKYWVTNLIWLLVSVGKAKQLCSFIFFFTYLILKIEKKIKDIWNICTFMLFFLFQFIHCHLIYQLFRGLHIKCVICITLYSGEPLHCILATQLERYSNYKSFTALWVDLGYLKDSDRVKNTEFPTFSGCLLLVGVRKGI